MGQMSRLKVFEYHFFGTDLDTSYVKQMSLKTSGIAPQFYQNTHTYQHAWITQRVGKWMGECLASWT